jgi:hypothetical protein
MRYLFYTLLSLTAFFLLPFSLEAQVMVVSNGQGNEGYYYSPEESLDASYAHAIEDNSTGNFTLYLHLTEKYFANPNLKLTLYNWQRIAVTATGVSRNYGENYFKIDISGVTSGEYYVLEARDENGFLGKLRIRFLKSSNAPISLTCKDVQICETAEEAFFSVSYTGGTAPYTVAWYVSNGASFPGTPPVEEMTNVMQQTANYQIPESFLHTPPSPTLPALPFYVHVRVTDVCGNPADCSFQVTGVVCEEDEETIPTSPEIALTNTTSPRVQKESIQKSKRKRFKLRLRIRHLNRKKKLEK